VWLKASQTAQQSPRGRESSAGRAPGGRIHSPCAAIALAPRWWPALACERPLEDLMRSESSVAVATAPAVMPAGLMCKCARCCL